MRLSYVRLILEFVIDFVFIIGFPVYAQSPNHLDEKLIKAIIDGHASIEKDLQNITGSIVNFSVSNKVLTQKNSIDFYRAGDLFRLNYVDNGTDQ
jgi:hypothetical protein